MVENDPTIAVIGLSEGEQSQYRSHPPISKSGPNLEFYFHSKSWQGEWAQHFNYFSYKQICLGLQKNIILAPLSGGKWPLYRHFK